MGGNEKSAYFHYYGTIREGWLTRAVERAALTADTALCKEEKLLCIGVLELEL